MIDALNWDEEHFVRLYTRDTPSWILLPWEARALFVFLLRRVDGRGEVELGKSGMRGLAASVWMPEEVVVSALAALVDDGCVVRDGNALVIRGFFESQVARMSVATRQRSSRQRRRLDPSTASVANGEKPTWIYFARSVSGGHLKIGQSSRPNARIFELSTGRPDELSLLAKFRGVVRDERAIHSALSEHRVNGEWFEPHAIVLAAAGAAAEPGATAASVLAACSLSTEEQG